MFSLVVCVFPYPLCKDSQWLRIRSPSPNLLILGGCGYVDHKVVYLIHCVEVTCTKGLF